MLSITIFFNLHGFQFTCRPSIDFWFQLDVKILQIVFHSMEQMSIWQANTFNSSIEETWNPQRRGVVLMVSVGRRRSVSWSWRADNNYSILWGKIYCSVVNYFLIWWCRLNLWKFCRRRRNTGESFKNKTSKNFPAFNLWLSENFTSLMSEGFLSQRIISRSVWLRNDRIIYNSRKIIAYFALPPWKRSDMNK